MWIAGTGLTGEVHNWELIKTSTLFKQEYKQGNVEITCSYLNAAKSLYLDLKRENAKWEMESLFYRFSESPTCSSCLSVRKT